MEVKAETKISLAKWRSRDVGNHPPPFASRIGQCGEQGPGRSWVIEGHFCAFNSSGVSIRNLKFKLQDLTHAFQFDR